MLKKFVYLDQWTMYACMLHIQVSIFFLVSLSGLYQSWLFNETKKFSGKYCIIITLVMLIIFICIYSRTSMAQTLMAHLTGLARTIKDILCISHPEWLPLARTIHGPKPVWYIEVLLYMHFTLLCSFYWLNRVHNQYVSPDWLIDYLEACLSFSYMQPTI